MNRTHTIGCTHLGKGDEADDFGPDNGPQAMALRALCAGIEEDGDYLIINGDFADIQQARVIEIRHAHEETLEAVKRVVKAYVWGNHDEYPPRELLGIRAVPHLVWGETYWEHWHRHDEFVARWPWVSGFVVGIVGWLERRWDPDVDVWASRLWGWMNGVGRHSDANAPYLRPAALTAWANGCTRCIGGHTHRIQVRPTAVGIGIYGGDAPWIDVYNSGCWIQVWDPIAQKLVWRRDVVTVD